jgi:sulfur transfer complex TusBCD TusB component (DsrH family)
MRTNPMTEHALRTTPMNEFVLHEDELARALDELAEIVEIICAPTIPPPPPPRRSP